MPAVGTGPPLPPLQPAPILHDGTTVEDLGSRPRAILPGLPDHGPAPGPCPPAASPVVSPTAAAEEAPPRASPLSGLPSPARVSPTLPSARAIASPIEPDEPAPSYWPQVLPSPGNRSGAPPAPWRPSPPLHDEPPGAAASIPGLPSPGPPPGPPPPPPHAQSIFALGQGVGLDADPWSAKVQLPWSGDPGSMSSTGRLIGGPCCCGCVSVCAVMCAGMPVVGATVQALSGGTVVASCVTGTTGCCELCIVGTYEVKVTVSGTVVYDYTRTLTAGGHIVIALPAGASVVCCGSYAVPTSFTLTDAAGSLAFDYYSGSYYPTWYGGHAVSKTSCTVTTPNDICVVADPSTGPVRVCYQMICYGGSSPAFTLQRSWSWVYMPSTFTPIWYQDPSGFITGQPCATGPPAMCGSPHTDIATDSQNPTSTGPFAISFNPVAAGSNYTADPVGGSVAIS